MRERSERPRGFRLLVEPGSDADFGLRLEETDRAEGSSRTVAHLPPSRVERIRERALGAVRAAGYAPSELSSRRRAPFALSDVVGVRFALTMLATGPLRKPSRVEAIAAAVDRLSDEEAYYWYAKCVGESAGRSRRAFRLMLAEE
jgi:hypothetical protein